MKEVTKTKIVQLNENEKARLTQEIKETLAEQNQTNKESHFTALDL
ncbi:MAG: hypothetical protein JST23_11465 [Bacteroidetes bacterium]|nr:hypothetical protein [Bacteroidota bacterium]